MNNSADPLFLIKREGKLECVSAYIQVHLIQLL